MSMQTNLENEINARFEEIEAMTITTDEYRKAVDDLAKLVDRAIELNKLDQAAYDKEKDRQVQLECKSAEVAEKRRENIITGAGIITGAILTVWGTIKSLKFEETGSITTMIGRGFINKLLPKK